MDVRTALVQLREELHMRQTDLAAALGVSYATVNRWETGKNTPSRAMSLAIVAFAASHGASKLCQATLRDALISPEETPGIDSLKYAELTQINALVNDSSNAVLVSDANTHDILYANRAMSLVSGKPLEAASQMKCYEYLFGKAHPCEFCIVPDLSHTEFCTGEYESPTTGRYYVSRGKMIQWSGKKAHIEYIADMTAFHQAKKKLAHQQELMTCAFEDAQMWVFTLNIQTGSVFLETAMQQALHLRTDVPDFVEKLMVSDPVSAAYVEEYRRVVSALQSGEKSAEAVVQTRIHSKRVHWVRLRAKTVEYDGAGKPLLAACSAQMIDEEMALLARIHFEHEQVVGSRKDLMGYVISDITQNRVMESRQVIDRGLTAQPGGVYDETIRFALHNIEPSEDRDLFAKIHQRAFLLDQFAQGKLEQDIEYQLVQPDGARIWVHDEMKLTLHPSRGNVVLYEYCYAVHAKKILKGVLRTIIQNGYDAFGAVSLANDQVARLRFDQNGELIDHALSFASYTQETAAYCEKCVVPEEKTRFLQAMSIERVRKELENKNIYRVAYHERTADGKIRTKVSEYSLCDRKYQFCLLSVWDERAMHASIHRVTDANAEEQDDNS